MAKRGPRRLKIGVQSRFGPNSTVELEAVFRKKFWGGLLGSNSHNTTAINCEALFELIILANRKQNSHLRECQIAFCQH